MDELSMQSTVLRQISKLAIICVIVMGAASVVLQFCMFGLLVHANVGINILSSNLLAFAVNTVPLVLVCAANKFYKKQKYIITLVVLLMPMFCCICYFKQVFDDRYVFQLLLPY